MGQGHTPWPISALAVVALLMIVAPLVALLLRVNWAEFPSVLMSSAVLAALGLSFGTALIATLVCVVVGVPLGMAIARARSRVANVSRALVLVPLLMPPLVGGLALFSLFGRNGLLGSWLSTLGITLPFTTPAVVIAQVFVALPFLVISVEQAVRALDPRLEPVARTLGTSRNGVLWRVTLPLIRPAIAAGATMSFSRSLAEFGATALFAGNVEGVTRTMPLAIYSVFNGAVGGPEQAYALAVILVASAVAVLIAVRGWRVNGL
ncbi:molybdate ABC transporter permease subunit [Gulosibacter chungangensis]|uniref:Molybdenum transport system permease n=2 Tax=Gulosibacter chungangensis TaxID=979746 RepID=A0A7J5BGD9_9MICO|nr:molybdate ABC transporter permease subunit [Gulosibacter chungangensis]